MYDNINHELFDVIESEKEIKITYMDGGFWSQNDIMQIEYEGIGYLKVDDIIEDMKKSDRISKIICSCIIVITTILSFSLFMLNYKKYRGAKIVLKHFYFDIIVEQVWYNDIKPFLYV